MKVSFTQIEIPQNYVLVLADKEFDKFQHNGKDLLDIAPPSVEDSASHYSVRGKVFAVPNCLMFNLAKIQANKIPAPYGLSMQEVLFYFKSKFVENNDYKTSSTLFDVPMEVCTGDIVYFNYQEHYRCYTQATYVDTIEHGEMMLMRYDSLIAKHPEDAPADITMLNGYVLVEPITGSEVFGSNLYEKNGILIPNMREAVAITKKKKNVGYVRFWGSHCKGYLDFSDKQEAAHEFTDGDIIVYNPKKAPSLEFTMHQKHFGGKQLVKIQRRDIFCVLPDRFKKELESVILDVHLN